MGRCHHPRERGDAIEVEAPSLGFRVRRGVSGPGLGVQLAEIFEEAPEEVVVVVDGASLRGRRGDHDEGGVFTEGGG